MAGGTQTHQETDDDAGMSLPPGGQPPMQPPPQSANSDVQLLPHNLKQMEGTMKRIVQLGKAGKSARRINIKLAEEGKLNSEKQPWNKSGGRDQMVIGRVLKSQGVEAKLGQYLYAKADTDVDEADEDAAASHAPSPSCGIGEGDAQDDVELREQSIAALHEEGGTEAVAAVIHPPFLSLQSHRATKKPHAPPRAAPPLPLGRGQNSRAKQGARRVSKRSGPRDLSQSDGENDGPQFGQSASRSAPAAWTCVDLDDSEEGSDRAEGSEDEDGNGGDEEMAVDGSDGRSRPRRKRSSPFTYNVDQTFKSLERKASGRPVGRLPVQRAAPAAQPKQALSRSSRSPPLETTKPVKKRAQGGGGLSASRTGSLKPLGLCHIAVEYGQVICEFSTDSVSNYAALSLAARTELNLALAAQNQLKFPGEISAFQYTNAHGHTVTVASQFGLYSAVQSAVKGDLSPGLPSPTHSTPVLHLRALPEPAGVLALTGSPVICD